MFLFGPCSNQLFGGVCVREVSRILSHPIREQGTTPTLSPMLERWSEHLWPVQLEALATLATQPHPLGIYGDIGVGGGKFLIATLAGTVLGAKRPIVLTKPDLIRQAESEYDRFKELFPEVEGHRPTYVAYSTLSQTKSGQLLWKLKPDLIVLDEAHCVASRTSARTRRLLDYVIQNPDTRVCVLSGTLNRKSLQDVAHLAEMALRDTMWLPIRDDILKGWSQVLDHGAVPNPKDAKRLLQPLVRWSEAKSEDAMEAYREAYRRRYLTTPGVIAPPETDVRCSLVLHQWRVETPPPIHAAVRALADDWILPDGTQLVDALEYWRHGTTLSCGFYYRPIWEGPDIEQWQDLRREWHRALRTQLQYIRQPGLDSPALVEQACVGGWAHPNTIRAYEAWLGVRDTVTQDSEVVWIDRSLVDAALTRARSYGRCLLWYESSRAWEPVLRAAGIPVYGAGSEPPTPNVRIAALSRHVHGTGKNLQAWDTQIVLEPPSSATPWEQMLGRTHRPGQLSDEVRVDILCATWMPRSRIYSATQEAEYIEKTSNKRHKLTFCTWAS